MNSQDDGTVQVETTRTCRRSNHINRCRQRGHGSYVRADALTAQVSAPTGICRPAVAAACSPRARPGVPASFPVAWDSPDGVSPQDFTVLNAARLPTDSDPWAAAPPPPRALPEDLAAEGHTIPAARVQTMQEGKRCARARRGPPHAAG